MQAARDLNLIQVLGQLAASLALFLFGQQLLSGSQGGGLTEIRSGLAMGQKVVFFEYQNRVHS